VSNHEPDYEPSLSHDVNAEWILDGQNMGAVQHTIAFQDAWACLYSSWNGAFVSNYPELFFAKLYNPVVLGVDSSLYLTFRVLALYTHLHMVLFSRAKLGQRKYSQATWSNPALRSLWGRINRLAAHEYQQRIERALSIDQTKLRNYRLARRAKQAGWLSLRTALRAARLRG
jgi:hypothetical protein